MRALEVIVGSALLVLALSGLGQLLWPLPPVPAVPAAAVVPTGPPIEPARPAGVPGPAVPRPAGPTTEERVVVDAPGGRLSGAVVRPVGGGATGAGAGSAALVLVSGDGPARFTALLPMARALAGHGLVVLVHDRRPDDDGPLRRDLAALGRDARAALAALRTSAGVDPARTGFAGVGEGGWVVAAAAAGGRDSPPPAFAVLLATPVVTTAERVQWLLDSGLLRSDAPDGARAAIVQAQALTLPDGLLAHTRQAPEPALEALRAPVLAVHGAADAVVPVADSIHRLEAALAAPPSVVVLDGVDHDLAGPVGGGVIDPRVGPLVADWVAGLPASADGAVRGTEPVQLWAARPQPPDPAGGIVVVLAGTALVLAGVLVGPVVAVAGRVSRRGGPRPAAPSRLARVVPRLLAPAAAAQLVVLAGGLAGLAAVAVTGTGGPVATGGIWLLVRLGALALVVLAVWAVVAAVSRDGRAGWYGRRAAAAGAGVAVVGALVLSARAGLFAPLW